MTEKYRQIEGTSSVGEKVQIKYLPQQKRGLNIIHQKFNGQNVASRRKLQVLPQDDLGIFRAIGELLDQMEKSRPARELRFNHRSITGWISGGQEEGQVQFESTLERDFAYLAFFDHRAFELVAQPFSLQYRGIGNTPCRYTPDFQLKYYKSATQIQSAIVEVKYKKDLDENYDELKPRFDAMEAWCEQNDAEFHIVTDEHIRTTRIENVKALYPFKINAEDDGEKSAELTYFVSQNAPISIGSILSRLSGDQTERARVQHNLWKRIAIGKLWVNLDENITFDTLVYAEPIPDTYGLFFSHASF